jgi:hypothetical protein
VRATVFCEVGSGVRKQRLALSIGPNWVGFHQRTETKSSLQNPVLSKQEVLGRTNRLLSLTRHGPHWKRRVQQFFYCCVCIRYRGKVSTEPLPSNDKGIFTEPLPSNNRGIHIQTHRLMGGNFNLAVEMGSSATIYVPGFIKIGSGIQKLTGGDTHTHTRRQQRDPVSLLNFYSK